MESALASMALLISRSTKGPEAALQQLQRLADSFVIRDGHAICYP
jgi:hypothetical protein